MSALRPGGLLALHRPGGLLVGLVGGRKKGRCSADTRAVPFAVVGRCTNNPQVFKTAEGKSKRRTMLDPLGCAYGLRAAYLFTNQRVASAAGLSRWLAGLERAAGLVTN